MAAPSKLQQVIPTVHYLSPAVLVAYYLLATALNFCTLHNLKPSRPCPRLVLLGLMSMVLLAYSVEACMLLIDTLANHGRFSSTDGNVSEAPV